jgi:lipid A 4'-phosphatase
MNTSKLLKWGLPFFILLLVGPFSSTLDLFLSNHYYSDESFSSHPYFTFFYHYGCYPAFILGGIATIIFFTSFFRPNLKRFRLPTLFLSLTLLCGPGILINGILKGFFSRPRPVQTLNFGGTEVFQPFYNISLTYPNLFKSFPSGHSTMGFYFFNLIFLGQRLKKPTLIASGILITLFMGLSLSISRIAQGGHFFSDTLTSLCLIWYVGLICDWFIFDFLAKNIRLRYIKD